MKQLCILILFYSFAISGDKGLSTDKYIGTATDLKSGMLVYTEEHETLYDGDKHISSKITYRDAKKKVIAEKLIELNGSSVAKFRLEDFRFGTVEGAEPASNGIKVYSKANSKEELKEKILTIPMPTATDAGLNVLVRDYWERIQKGERVDFHLGVPSQLDYYHFRVVKDREEQFNGMKTLVVRFESDFWFLRMILDPVIVWYDAATGRAVKYEGISNIYDEKGKSYIVRVTFDKPGP
jgi:hypothetical protein